MRAIFGPPLNRGILTVARVRLRFPSVAAAEPDPHLGAIPTTCFVTSPKSRDTPELQMVGSRLALSVNTLLVVPPMWRVQPQAAAAARAASSPRPRP